MRKCYARVVFNLFINPIVVVRIFFDVTHLILYIIFCTDFAIMVKAQFFQECTKLDLKYSNA